MNRERMEFRAVILAAGESKRMGAQKLLMPYRGRAMIDRAIDAALPWRPLVVAGSEVAQHCLGRSDIELAVNEHPERGMSYSLALANPMIPVDDTIIVLLGDKPLVTPELIARLCNDFAGADVLFPRDPQSGRPGHPVLFSPRARAKIASLPDGDSLHTLRDDPLLARREVATGDRGAYFDIDTAASLAE